MHSFHTTHYMHYFKISFLVASCHFLFLQCMLVRNKFDKTDISLTRRTSCLYIFRHLDKKSVINLSFFKKFKSSAHRNLDPPLLYPQNRDKDGGQKLGTVLISIQGKFLHDSFSLYRISVCDMKIPLFSNRKISP